MNELSVRDCMKIQIAILDKLHDYCEKNNLTYVLGFGTLIGAVRHNGFIPWDDDIDVFMPRRDYEILCKEFEADGYKLYCHHKDAAYPYQFAKISDESTVLIESSTVKYDIGVYVDVFPFDNIPADAAIKNKYYKKLNRMNRTIICKTVTAEYETDTVHRIYHRAVKILTAGCSVPNIVGKIEKTIEKAHKFPSGGNVACYTFRNGWKWELPYDAYFKKTLHEFEGKKYCIPADYDTVLRRIYGDYMKLPPEEKRVSNHVYKAYSK